MADLAGLGTDRTPTARTGGADLTADRLGDAWPSVSARLRRMLASRGVDASLNEDIVQEVAVRALDKRVPFTDPDDLYRWAATAARRLHIDHLRTDHRTTCDDELVAVADGTDVAHTAERRVVLAQVFQAMSLMRPRERDAILESLEENDARSPQVLVRRHRARATLRKAVAGVLSTVWLARLRLRAVSPAFQEVAVVAALAPALALGATAVLDRPSDVPSRAPRVAAAPSLGAVPRDVAPPAPRATRAPQRPVPSPAAPARTTGRASVPGAQDAAPPYDPPAKKAGPIIIDPSPPGDDSRQKPPPVLCVGNGGNQIWCTPEVPPAT